MSASQELSQAQAHQRAGRHADARAGFARAVQVDPANATAWYLRGIHALTTRDPALAAESLQRTVALKPDWLEAHCNLGVALQSLHRPADAAVAYRAALRLQPAFAEVHGNLGNALHAQGDLSGAIAAYREALRLKPALADVHNSLGVALKAHGQLDAAVTAYREALARQPDHLSAQLNLALALEAQGQFAAAAAAYREILLRDPGHIAARLNLGSVLQAQGDLAAAIAEYRTVLAAQPTNVEALTNLGTALQAQNDLPGALESYGRALAQQPELPQARFNESVCRLLAGDLAAGWPGYEARWQTEQAKFKRPFPAPLWLGDTSLAGKTILVYPEQGLGDTLQFARYVPLLAARGARVLLEVQPPLRTLFEGFPGAAAVFARSDPLPAFDFHCPMLSLPGAFRTEWETIPPPIAPSLSSAGSAPLSSNDTRHPRVGLVWSGGRFHKTDHLRSIPLAAFKQIVEPALARFICLQKEIKDTEAALLATTAAIEVVSAQLHDFNDTAALIAQLDLVITVDTSVAHLAATLGRPTWILLPFAPDWRWLLERTDSPWYPSVRLFRQPAPGDWSSVLATVTRELAWFKK